MIFIENIDDDRINHYRSLRFTPKSHTVGKVFIAEGEKVTLKILSSKVQLISVFITPEFFQKYESLILRSKISEEQIFIAEKNLMEKIVGFDLHAGIMAMCKIPDDSSIVDMSSKIVILNGIINSENVGSIVRNCVAFGIDSLIVDEQTSSPYLRRAVRVSMGNVIDLKIHHSKNISETIITLCEKGYSIIAAEITENTIPIHDFHFPDKFALIFGTEGQGIKNELLNLAQHVVHIPINPVVSSLNVAVSSALFLYEMNKSENLIPKF